MNSQACFTDRHIYPAGGAIICNGRSSRACIGWRNDARSLHFNGKKCCIVGRYHRQFLIPKHLAPAKKLVRINAIPPCHTSNRSIWQIRLFDNLPLEIQAMATITTTSDLG